MACANKVCIFEKSQEEILSGDYIENVSFVDRDSRS